MGNIKRSKIILIILFDILLVGGISSAINTSATYISSNSSNIPKSQGGFNGDYYFDYDWENSTLDQWNFTDDFQYDEYFLLNNGTEDVWVRILSENNVTTSNSGEIKYFTFKIFEDPDNSVLINWEDNWEEFESIDWQGYQYYYWDYYSDEWDEYSDPFLDEPEAYFNHDEDNSSFSEPSETNDWGSMWSEDDLYKDYSDAYNIMHERLTGDESWWFLNIYFENWDDTYIGTVNYTWFYDDTGEIFDPNSVDLGPAVGYEFDWEIAQTMITNETFDYNNSWTWFSYGLSQWVSWFDVVSDSINFITADTSYTGMSIFKDHNENGIADVFYNYEEEYGEIYYDQNQSEIQSLITLDSIENIDFGLNFEQNSEDLGFWVSLEGVSLTTLPYGYGYEPFFVEDEYFSEQESQFYLDNLNLSFYYEPQEISNEKTQVKSSSFSIKQDLSEFLYPSNHSSAISEFEGMSLTIDYIVNSDVFSSIVGVDESTTSYELESQEVDGEVNVQTEDSTLMRMNLTQKYKWGKDGKDYNNTVTLSPIYGFDLNYGDMELGVASVYNDQISPYSYSLCFENWDGYSISMDPTFTSYYTYQVPGFQFPIYLLYGIIPLAALIGIIMSKQEYRSFLLNRVLQIETGAHRLTMEDVLENENRSKVIDFIVDDPGIHFSELLRRTNLAPGNLNWHIEILERYKIIKSEIVGKYVIYFPYHGKNPLSNIDLKLQKSKTTMEILAMIQTTPGITQNQIAKCLEKNHKTVKYHLDKLIEVDLIEKRKKGRKNLLYSTIQELTEDIEIN